MADQERDDGPPRDVMARAIMATATEENGLADHLLVGFVVVAEWATEGGRVLTFTCGSGEGEFLPEWTAQGYLANALGSMADWTYGGDVRADPDD